MPNKYKIKLENFEGPLDLLLHLIEKNEIDIYDIPIARVTDQYIVYIKELEYLDLDLASEFLVLAATLLSIKAKMLLPKPIKNVEEDEVDPREELVARLLEYKQYKNAAIILKEQEKQMLKVFVRELDEKQLFKQFCDDNPVEKYSINDLFDAFRIILEKSQEIEPSYEITREEFTIQECAVAILEKLNLNSRLLFSDLLPLGTSRTKLIMTFLALLELIKLKQISFVQKDAFGKIIIYLKDDAL